MFTKQSAAVRAFFLALFLSSQVLMTTSAWAAEGTTARDEIAKQLTAAAGDQGAGVGTYTDPRQTAALIIQVLLTLVGTIFFVLTVYAGYLWMTAQGNEEEIEKAKMTLRNAILGLVIVIAAYGITLAATNLTQGKRIGTNADNGNGYSLEQGVNDAIFGK